MRRSWRRQWGIWQPWEIYRNTGEWSGNSGNFRDDRRALERKESSLSTSRPWTPASISPLDDRYLSSAMADPDTSQISKMLFSYRKIIFSSAPPVGRDPRSAPGLLASTKTLFYMKEPDRARRPTYLSYSMFFQHTRYVCMSLLA